MRRVIFVLDDDEVCGELLGASRCFQGEGRPVGAIYSDIIVDRRHKNHKFRPGRW